MITDRNGKEILIAPNAKGYYARFEEKIPPRFSELLIRKEDRLFNYHLGINPFSIMRDAASFITTKRLKGSSTITQQLVKTLLGHENERTLKNKLTETAYAIALELHAPKEKIITMYANSAYFGNRAEGLGEASRFYFNLPPELLNDRQIVELLATLNSPSERYPGKLLNRRFAASFAEAAGLGISEDDFGKEKIAKSEDSGGKKTFTPFELQSLGVKCQSKCQLTIDQDLTEKLRDMLDRNLHMPSFATAQNGAIVVIKFDRTENTNELLAIVGSPNPSLNEKSYQTNMAIKPRAIGSTAKPFIYVKAFEKGARPYTLVDDREYKYEIGTGYAFYPKNFDGQYRGTVTLHQALSNSLNVPTVKVLEYAGLDNFYDFMEKGLGFKPIQPLESYELGIALGGLEMDLLTLVHYFSIFANEGELKPLKIYAEPGGPYLVPPQASAIDDARRVAGKEFVELVNKILADRETGIDQFGMKSNLNLSQAGYAVKTGTSRDYHDSWTIGYTPDFLVGVWLGNSDNTPMHQFSGQTGAGKIWHEAMEMVINSPYSHKTAFDFSAVKEFNESSGIEYGLAGDDYQEARAVMQEKTLILSPHHGDAFLLESATIIPLEASEPVEWKIDGVVLGQSEKLSWQPVKTGSYIIRVKTATGETQSIRVEVNREE